MDKSPVLFIEDIPAHELFKTLLKGLPVPVFIFTGQEFILQLGNDAAYKVFNKDEQMVGLCFKSVFPGTEWQEFYQALRKVYAEGNLLKAVDVEYLDEANQFSHFRFSFEPLFDRDNQLYGVMTTGIDVTTEVMTEKRARLSKVNFSNTLLQSPIAIASVSYPEYVLELANDKMLDFWGVERNKVMGKSLWACLPHLRKELISMIAQTVINGKASEFKEVELHLFRGKSVDTMLFNLIFQPVFNEREEVTSLIIFAIDVSKEVFNRKYIEQTKGTHKSIYEKLYATNIELIQAHEELCTLNNELETRVQNRTIELRRSKKEAVNQRERLYRLFMEAPAGICMLSGPELVFELINPLYKQLLPGKRILGMPLLEAMPEIRGQLIYEIILNVYRTGVTFDGKELLVQIISPVTGIIEDRYFDFIYQARYDPEGNIDGVIVFAYDVTQQVNSRRLIEEKEQEFRQVMESMDQLSWTNTPSGKCTFFNQRWYEYTGLDYDSSMESALRNVVHPDDYRDTLSKLTVALKSGEKLEIENRLKHHDGSYCWHLSRAVPIKNDQGEITLWVGTATNINELKKLQQQREEFISIASHELKTPLTSLSGSLQILERAIRKETNTPPIISKMAFSSLTHLKRVTGLVNDLLSSTKIEQGQLVLKKEHIKLVDLVNDCCDHVRIEGKYTIRAEGDFNLKVFADKHKLEQVIVNLVNNAVKYAPESKEIVIRLQSQGEVAKVSVQDFGPGIPPDKVTHLFDRFYRVDNSGFQQTGLGLGLYICQQIVEKHGGQIGIESEIGKGSTFWFTVALDLAENPIAG